MAGTLYLVGVLDAQGLHCATDTKSAWFAKTTAEVLRATAQFCAERTPPGGCQTVHHRGYVCHTRATAQPVAVAIAITDEAYPVRAAYALLFKATPASVDALLVAPIDPLARVQSELDETKVVVLQTLDALMRRGEQLDDMIAKSGQLSDASKTFLKQARKTNSCCTIL